MDKLIEQFPKHLIEASKIGRAYVHAPDSRMILNIVVAGMGGSGIAGRIISDLIKTTCKIPFVVINDDTLPNFVNSNTLVIICSYSGSTEETLLAFHDARRRNALIVSITSGGELLDLCKKYSLDCLSMPVGGPPRAFLGYSLTLILSILSSFEIIEPCFEEIESFAGFCRKLDFKEAAAKLAFKISGKDLAIYTHNDLEGVALRLRQQINENVKFLVTHAVIPEMNHNEMAAWFSPVFPPDILMLHGSLPRFHKTRDILQKRSKVHDIVPFGNPGLEHILYHIHFGDWLSFFLAEEEGADPMEIKMIDEIKSGQTFEK